MLPHGLPPAELTTTRLRRRWPPGRRLPGAEGLHQVSKRSRLAGAAVTYTGHQFARDDLVALHFSVPAQWWSNLRQCPYPSQDDRKLGKVDPRSCCFGSRRLNSLDGW